MRRSNQSRPPLYPDDRPDGSPFRPKWNTPKKNHLTKVHTTSKKKLSPKKTHHKHYAPDFSDSESVGLEWKLQQKFEQFQVVRRTLEEYIKGEKLVRNSNSRKMELAIKMAKAFTKTEIKKLSPAANALILEMLNCLPLPSPKPRRKHELHTTKHKKQFSFAHTQPLPEAYDLGQILSDQIRELEESLWELRQEKEVMEDIEEEFQDMTSEQKKEYIRELEGILEDQRRLLKKLQEEEMRLKN